ncbi:hypothetical protein QQZ08_003563 [Neonectria magnoliae]|uniref:Uncharacterized protein n=1 Tax=Neonectria magnoliae TaxID=2732573 RepID=A0ABR1I8S7_9HYPO
MACDCCGPPAQSLEPIQTQLEVQDDGASGCCSDESCDGGGDAVGSTSEETKPQDTGEKAPVDLFDAGKNIEDMASEDTAVPSCCRGIQAPCCDVSCLDRLALRECEKNSPTAQVDGISSGTPFSFGSQEPLSSYTVLCWDSKWRSVRPASPFRPRSLRVYPGGYWLHLSRSLGSWFGLLLRVPKATLGGEKSLLQGIVCEIRPTLSD